MAGKYYFPRCDEGKVSHIAIARITRGVSEETLALQVGVELTTLQLWERGVEEPSSAQLKRLKLALRWPLWMFTANPLPEVEAEALVEKHSAKIAAS